ncbi:hypothetical protein XELAEV_18004631mg [Xenopus laevis]|uniref:Uncharacterized protein n=1 Tax=Xenopus laevis TaxID=8355 RepID=A0A974GZJ0_XENLA|nr:hypothetical protein XELAEV_18004631mg [Xenopus laevis]
MIGAAAGYIPYIVLIYLTVLYVEPCISSRVQSSNPACHLEIIKTYEEYEYIKEGDIMIGGVLTMNSCAVHFAYPWDNFNRILCVQ